MVGSHVIKCWAATQVSVALSSGEAEFYGVVRAGGIALGHKALLEDVGLKLPARVWTDSSAAIGTCGRQGVGKLRHVAYHTMWVQQRLRQGEFQLRKIRGEVNPADLFTKFIESKPKIDQLTALFGCEFWSGRADAAPQLRKEGLRMTDAEGADNDDDGAYALDPGEMHDPDVLPHMYT